MKYTTNCAEVILIPETEFEQHDLKAIYEKISKDENRLATENGGNVLWWTDPQIHTTGGATTTPLGALVMCQ